VRSDPKYINDVWSAEAADDDGRQLRICVVVDLANNDMLVVTAIDL